jgi:hypothetical protein
MKVTLLWILEGDHTVVCGEQPYGFVLTIPKLMISQLGVSYYELQMSGMSTEDRTMAAVSRTPSVMANRLSRRG